MAQPRPLLDVSKPSIAADNKRPPARNKYRSAMSIKRRRSELEKKIRHEQNALAHRGEQLPLDYAREKMKYIAGALAITQPYAPNGSVRPSGDKEEFFLWLGFMRDFVTATLPFHHPRLSSIHVSRDNNAEDQPEEYETVWELRAKMVKRGLPINDLIVEHELAHAGAAEQAAGPAAAD